MQLEFAGVLTEHDIKRHIEHRFDVPDGVTVLSINFQYAPQKPEGQRYANQLSLSLFDPHGSRGARHNNRDQSLRLTATSATPGYLAGELMAGEWNVVIDSHRLLAGTPVEYTIQIEMQSDPVQEDSAPFTLGKTAPRGAGWYRGDLHAHTLHSDGSWDVLDLIQYARDYQLDFVTLSDHNTVSGLAQLDSLASDDLLPIGAMELTTYYGHALALGTRQWHEWRVSNTVSMRDLAQKVLDSGALFVIAHPTSIGDPVCTGCDWQYEDMMPGISPAVEIWNGLWSDENQQAVELYYQWLNAGHRLVATAGTDIHGRPAEGIKGASANVVYAEVLSEKAILDAIRAGHSYISGGPTLTFTANTSDDYVFMMGDTLPSTEQVVNFYAGWAGCDQDDIANVIVDGVVLTRLNVSDCSSHRWSLEPDSFKWCTLEIRGADQSLKSITNPIFADA